MRFPKSQTIFNLIDNVIDGLSLSNHPYIYGLLALVLLVWVPLLILYIFAFTKFGFIAGLATIGVMAFILYPYREYAKASLNRHHIQERVSNNG